MKSLKLTVSPPMRCSQYKYEFVCECTSQPLYTLVDNLNLQTLLLVHLFANLICKANNCSGRAR